MVRTQTKNIKKAMAQAFSDLLSGRIGRHMSKEINPPKKAWNEAEPMLAQISVVVQRGSNPHWEGRDSDGDLYQK